MEIQGNRKVSFAAVSSISVQQAHWHQTCFPYAHFRPVHVWEVKMGACWYRLLRLLISGVLLSGTQSRVASDEMHCLQQAKGGCPLLLSDRDFFFPTSPRHKTGVQVSRKEVSWKKKRVIFAFFLKSKKQVNLRMFIIFVLFLYRSIALNWQ